MRIFSAPSLFWASALVLALALGGPHGSGGQAQAQTAQGVWAKKSPLSGVRSETAIAELGGKIYLIGGNTVEMRNGMPVDRYDAGMNAEYDPKTDTWRTRAPMPKGGGHAGIAVMDGKIYVAGGFTVARHMGALDSFAAYDPKTDSWEVLPPLLSPRGSPNLVAIGGRLHIFGGRVNDILGPINAHDVYDPKTKTWTPAPQMPTARDHMGVGVFNGKIHVIGGRNGAQDNNLATHEIYDPQTGQWSTGAPMPTPRSGGAFATYRGMLFFIGGECRDRKTYPENEAYDPKTQKWSTYAPLSPLGLHAESALAMGDTLYVIGGASGCGGDGKSAEVQTFTLR
jgi:N-acetylneuraminic acid mutarotase